MAILLLSDRLLVITLYQSLIDNQIKFMFFDFRWVKCRFYLEGRLKDCFESESLLKDSNGQTGDLEDIGDDRFQCIFFEWYTLATLICAIL